VIRRAFWLSVGAAAGITSYRRATAVGRAISVRVAGDRSSAAPGPFWPPQPNRNGQRPASGPPPPAVGAPARPLGRPPALSRLAASAQPRPSPRPRPSAQPRPHPQWSTARAAWRTSRAAWRTQKAAIAQVRAAGRFARDVREGMDLYMNRQQGEPGPNLASAPAATGAPGTAGTNGRPRGRIENVKDGR
jgi:hypothetical protein